MDSKVICAYLQGAIHDGTYNRLHKTYRFTQSSNQWLMILKDCFQKLGNKAWIYKEGKLRGVYALETSAKFLDLRFDPNKLSSTEEQIAYVRGYFDAEGGIPKSSSHWFYIQLSQKNHEELTKVRDILEALNIKCGKIHIPSARVDPDYFRFFVSRVSHRDFARVVGSWHPRKQKTFELRMKI